MLACLLAISAWVTCGLSSFHAQGKVSVVCRPCHSPQLSCLPPSWRSWPPPRLSPAPRDIQQAQPPRQLQKGPSGFELRFGSKLGICLAGSLRVSREGSGSPDVACLGSSLRRPGRLLQVASIETQTSLGGPGRAPAASLRLPLSVSAHAASSAAAFEAFPTGQCCMQFFNPSKQCAPEVWGQELRHRQLKHNTPIPCRPLHASSFAFAAAAFLSLALASPNPWPPLGESESNILGCLEHAATMAAVAEKDQGDEGEISKAEQEVIL